MAIHRDMVVDLPQTSYVQERNGKGYVYLYTKFFRNEQGKSRNKSVAVGLLTEDGGTMHPNDNWLSMMRVPTRRKEGGVLSVGYTAAVESAFEDTGIGAVLEGALGEDDARDVRTVAAYMCKEGSVMSYVDEFSEREYFPGVDEVLTDRRVSVLFGSIDREREAGFYRGWVPAARSDGYICYDVTSVSTWSSMVEEAEYGYNRDHEKLRQLNMGLFHAEETNTPVYLDRYNGSVNDYTQVEMAVANARAAGLEGPFKLVTDGVFFQEEKLRALHEAGITVTCGMPAYLGISKSYVGAWRSEVLTDPSHYVGHHGTRAFVVEGQEIFGIPCRVLVGYDPEAAALLDEDLDRKIAQWEIQDIPAIKKYDTVTKRKNFTGLFDFHPVEGSKGFTFERNEEKIAEARRGFGFFTIFTTDTGATAREIVDTYRDKDVVEKQFMELKQYMGARRPRVHDKAHLDGKYFVLLVALVLRSWLRKRLSGYMKAHHLTLGRCLRKLSDIMMYVDDEEVRLLKAITKEQREILELLGVDPSKLEQQMREAIVLTH